jgi:hypothetical protein
VIKRILQWSTATLPPNFLKIILAGAVVTWALEWCFYTMLQLQYGQLPDDFRQVGWPRVWLLCCLVVWAGWRAFSLNPACQPRYLDWLRTTPWAPGKPLPLGRIELAPQDVLWLTAASVAFWHWPGSLFVPLAYLVPYALILSFINYATKRYILAGAATGLIAMLPLVAMSMGQPWLILGCAIAATATAEWGWRRALQDYPWEAAPASRFQFDALQRQEADGTCAWWPLVHPWRGTAIAPLLDWRETLLFAGFCSWLAATATMTINWIEVFEAARENRLAIDVMHLALPLVAGVAGVAAGLMRLYRYAIWCAWPISLLGRKRTGRLIIPGYDQVFIAPMTTMAAGLIIPNVLLLLGTPTAATAFVTTFAIIMSAVGMKPTLAVWSLTGEYHMMRNTPPARSRGR